MHLYEVDALRATVKQQMKIHWPPPSVNPSLAKVFNLYWDPREEHQLKSAGVWTGTSFVRMRAQHLRMKDRYPDLPAARGMPYEDVENLRPESKAMRETGAEDSSRCSMSAADGMPLPSSQSPLSLTTSCPPSAVRMCTSAGITLAPGSGRLDSAERQDSRTPTAGPCPNGEAERVVQVLRATGGNVSRAARRLGLARTTLRRRIREAGLQDLIPRD